MCGYADSPRRAYPSDLTDAQWALVRAAMPPAAGGRTGRPRTYALRAVWDHFRRWRDNGTLERVHAALREMTRVRAGRDPTPSLAIVDRQSVKTTGKGGPRASTPASA